MLYKRIDANLLYTYIIVVYILKYENQQPEVHGTPIGGQQ